MKARDYQRSKVYKLDKRIGELVGIDIYKQTMEMDEMKSVVKHLFKSNRLGVTPKIKDGRGRRKACGGKDSISMPKWSRNPVVLAHELSHVVIQRRFPGDAAHGAKFVGVYKEFIACMFPGFPIERFDEAAQSEDVRIIPMSNQFRERDEAKAA